MQQNTKIPAGRLYRPYFNAVEEQKKLQSRKWAVVMLREGCASYPFRRIPELQGWFRLVLCKIRL